MKRTLSPGKAAVLVGVLLCSPAFAQSSFDTIVGAKGVPVRGLVVEMSPDEVGLQQRGSVRKFPALEIQKISYAEDPRPLREARDDIREGRFRAALEKLKTINTAELRRDFVQQDVQYYTGYCLARVGLATGDNQAAAVTALLGFVRDHRNSYHFYEAAEILGDLAMALGSYENAAKYYGQLEKSAGTEVKLRGALLHGRALQAQGKLPDALKQFNAVAEDGTNTPEAQRLKTLATVGKVSLMAKAGKANDALPIIEEIIQKNDPKDRQLFARAYNALGACHQASRRDEDALLAYLHVDILFYGDADAHAEALFHLNKLWGKLGKADRAVQARNTLMTRYPGTVWAKK
jgi:TolA-binding protein